MARLFDAFIMADWSAASKPSTGANSIWIGVHAKDARFRFQFQAVNPDTRLKANQFLKDMIARLTQRGDKILVGFDFSLGYPAGTAAALGLNLAGNPPWKAIHAHLASKLKDKPDNSNARYAIAAGMNYAISKGPSPFWGAPSKDQVSTLSGTRPDYEASALSEFRLVEEHLKQSGKGNPKSCWQLSYAGSVGSQSLLGIPHVHDLRVTIPKSAVWPFETGFRESGDEEWLEQANVILAEVYPSLLKTAPKQGEVLDQAQVRTLCEHFETLDRDGDLAPLFAPPEGVDMEKNPQILLEEGWILGA